MTGKQEGPYKGEETKAEEDKLWHLGRNQEFWMCLVENPNRKCFVIIIYFIKYYKVIL